METHALRDNHVREQKDQMGEKHVDRKYRTSMQD